MIRTKWQCINNIGRSALCFELSLLFALFLAAREDGLGLKMNQS
jgi:hypothetical protein